LGDTRFVATYLAGPLVQPARAEPTASPAGPPASPHLPARSPAVQVAPVMVALASGGTGTHRLVLHLAPPELGHLEIRMTRSQEVGARIELTIDRPATLALLRQDEAALHRALSDAGVPPEGRSVSIQLGQLGSQDVGGHGGGDQRGSPRRPSRAGFWPATESGVVKALPALVPRVLRGALDITA